MNDHELDMALNRLLKQSSPPVPESVSSRVDQTLQSLKKRKRFPRKAAIGITAAAASLALLAGTSLVSPTIAKALSNTPIIGSVFEIIGDAGLQLSGQKGLVTKLNVAAEDQGVRMTVTDVLYDGIRLVIGYTIEAEHSAMPSNVDMLINGEPINTPLGGGGSSPYSEGFYTGYIDYEANGELPDQFELTLKLKSMQYYEEPAGMQFVNGAWNFKLPVSKLKEGITVHSFDPALQATSDNRTLAVNELTLTPAITALNVDLIEKSITENKGFFLYDDKGKQIQYYSYRGDLDYFEDKDLYKGIYNIRFAPFEDKPDYLVIKPYKFHTSIGQFSRKQTAFDLGSLPVTLTQGEAGSVTITEVEQLPDKTVLHFQVEGSDPYNQAGSVWLEDGNGQPLTKLSSHMLVDRNTYSFTQEYQPLPSDDANRIHLVSWQLPAPEIWDELAVRIPLK